MTEGSRKMKEVPSRRRFLMASGFGSIAVLAERAFGQSPPASGKPAVDRSNARWGNRPMFLRPYHPPYVVAYYGKREGLKSAKWSPLISRVETEPGLKVRIVESFDDACAGCSYLEAEPMGSVWGVGHSCSSAKDPAMVDMVTRTNERILGELGMSFGDEMPMRDLVALLQKKVPVLYEGIGGEANQKDYEKGLGDLVRKYGL